MDQMNAALASIAQSSARTNVTLQSMAESLEKLTTGTVRATTAVTGLGTAHARAVTDVQAASASIRAFEGNLSVRAVEQYTTKVLGLGNAFQIIFPLVGALATVEILVRIGEEIYKIAQSWSPAVQAAKEYLSVMKGIDSEIPALERQQRKIAVQTARYTAEAKEKGSGPEAAARTEAGFLRQDARQPSLNIDGREMSTVEIGNELRKQWRIIQLRRIPDEQGNFTTKSGMANAFQVAAAQTKATAYQSALDTLSFKSDNFNSEAGLKDIEAGNSARDRAESEARKAAAAAKAHKDALRTLDDHLENAVLPREFGIYPKDIATPMVAQAKYLRSVSESDLLTPDEKANRAQKGRDIYGQQITLGMWQYGALSQRNMAAFMAHSYDGGRTVTDPLAAMGGKGSSRLDLRDESETLRADEQIKGIQDRSAAQDITHQITRQGRLSQASFAGPGNEQNAINDAYSQRITLAKALRQIEDEAASKELDLNKQRVDYAKSEAEYRKQEQEAALDREVKILELKKQNQEKFVGQAEGAFRALVSGGGEGLRKYGQAQATDIGATIAGNAARMVYRPGAFNIPGLSADEGIGKFLKGTPFVGGGTPEDKQKNAADIQLKAATTMATAASLFYSGTTGSMAPSIPGLPSIPFAVPSLSSGTLGVLGMGGPGDAFAGATGGAGSSSTSLLTRILGPSLASSIRGFSGGASSVLGGNGWNVALGIDKSVDTGDGRATTLSAQMGNSNGSFSTAQQVGADAGLAATAITGGVTAYKQFSSGRTVQGVGTTVSTVAALDPEPISHAILAAAGTLISTFAGDPKADRQSAMDKLLATNTFYTPVARNVSAGMNGGLSDYDRFGQSRSSDISPYAATEAPYLDYRNGTYVPGRVTTGYSGYGPGGAAGAAGDGSAGGGGPLVVQNFNLMDTQSVLDRSQDIAAAMNQSIDQGGHGTAFLDKMRNA